VNGRSQAGPNRRKTSREIIRRTGLAGGDLPSSLDDFVDRHLGPERQLTRLALDELEEPGESSDEQ
jgi:hypothetical protein